MKKILLPILILSFLIVHASAMEFTAPLVPDAGQAYMPEENETFAQGLLYIIKSSISVLRPELAKAAGICFSLIVAVFLLSILQTLSKESTTVIRLVGAIIIGLLMLESIDSFIRLGTATVEKLSDYGKLLLPVMTSALAAQGGTTSSAAIYAGTIFFDTVLSTLINKIVVPVLYIFLCFSVAECAAGQEILKKIRNFTKWLMTWSLKSVLYIFTGYISITGVISGVVDLSALKATKLAISGMVPVVGGVLADASETILVSASVMKSTAGVYGIYALLALFVSPFLKIGVQYLLLKFSSAVCSIFGCKPIVDLIQDFSSGMGLILAMTCTVCLLQLISLVCFMKGIG